MGVAEEYHSMKAMPPLPKYVDPNHGRAIVEQLQSLRQDCILMDVTLRAGAELFPCHRSVLAACSPYFKAMLSGGMSESQQDSITLHDLESTTLKLILDYIYSGSILLDVSNVQDIFMAANLLQVTPLIHFCADFLEKSLSVSNCVGIFHLAVMYSCPSLEETSFEFINYHFTSVTLQDEFLNAQTEIVDRIVSSRNLNVGSEGQIFEAICSWYAKDSKNRNASTKELLRCVDTESLDAKQLLQGKREGLIMDVPPVIDGSSRLAAGGSGSTDVHRTSRRSEHEKVGRGYSRLGMSAQELLLLGCEQTGQHCLYCINTSSKDCFYLELPPICKTFGAISVVVDNAIYSITDDYQEKSVFRYNHIRRKWTEVAPRLHGRSSFQLQGVNGKIYVLGGLNDWHILNSVECYDPVVDEWSTASSMPRDVIDFTSAVHSDNIYIFSGSRTMCYNTTTDTWTATLPAMQVPRLHPASAGLSNEIWVIGGILASSDTEQQSSAIERYLPDRGVWEVAAPLPFQLQLCAASVHQDKLYLCGVVCPADEVLVAMRYPRYTLFHLDMATGHCQDMLIDLPFQDVIMCGKATLFTQNLTAVTQK